MKRFVGLFGSILFLCATQQARAGAITVDIYSGHSTVGGGTPYLGLAGSFTSNDVQFATSTGGNWHPFGLADFGADIRGFLSVPATSGYTFTLFSDDGSLLFIDGSLVVDRGGPQSFGSTSGSVTLTAGIHPFEVQFFEDFGGPSGVDLSLPTGVTFTQNVPEPGSLSLFGAGILALLGFRRRRMIA